MKAKLLVAAKDWMMVALKAEKWVDKKDLPMVVKWVDY